MEKTLKTMALVAMMACCLSLELPVSGVSATETPVYVGAETCGECHPDQYEAFTQNSKKAHSYSSIKKMAAKLTPEELTGCYACHTTGYGKPGGFRSETETPHLKDTGCEVCHGPGSRHVESEDPDDLNRAIGAEDCMRCHNAQRVAAFNFKPLLYGGAH